MSELQRQRQIIDKGGQLNRLHWLIVTCSITLTLFGWYFSKSQVEQRIEARFLREADQTLEMISERMAKYESALWSGVAAIKSLGGRVTYEQWKTFANSLQIDVRYPGINGIGVIYKVEPESISDFLSEQRRDRPHFRVHPQHNIGEFWPITYIEPEGLNARAVGLDIAHEVNRYEAAKRARNTGTAQITGPIVLVQDTEKTPGFLFYAPIDSNNYPSTRLTQPHSFPSLVYAPFVVKKLMQGTLNKDRRHIGIRISDGSQVVYDEHTALEDDFDEDPMYKISRTITLYGREWTFDFWSTLAFRKASTLSEPMLILFGGLLVDGFLLMLFILLSRSNRRAIHFADQMAKEAETSRMSAVHSSKMASLGEMAGGIAHEINNPLAIIQGYASMWANKGKCGKLTIANHEDYYNKIQSTVTRIKAIIDGLRTFSRDGSGDPFVAQEAKGIMEDAIGFCRERFKNQGIDLQFSSSEPIMLNCRKVQISQVLVNLLNNARSAVQNTENPWVKITLEQNGNSALIKVIDSGKGVPPENRQKLFAPFFTTKEVGSGTGLGLSISRGLVQMHGGNLYLDEHAPNTTFVIELPIAGDVGQSHRPPLDKCA
jgi:signal transduction histidine kinase